MTKEGGYHVPTKTYFVSAPPVETALAARPEAGLSFLEPAASDRHGFLCSAILIAKRPDFIAPKVEPKWQGLRINDNETKGDETVLRLVKQGGEPGAKK